MTAWGSSLAVCWSRGCARSIGRSIRSTRWLWPGIGSEPRARLREYYPGFLAAFAAGSGSGARAVHHPSRQRRRAGGAGHRAEPRGRPDGVKGPVRAALCRGGASVASPTSRKRGRRVAGPTAAPGPDRGAGDAHRDAGPARRAGRGLHLGRPARRRAGRGVRAAPDYEIITSVPVLADISGAIVLAEDRALQAFAGSAPITRA
jgi:hypothetical protein